MTVKDITGTVRCQGTPPEARPFVGAVSVGGGTKNVSRSSLTLVSTSSAPSTWPRPLFPNRVKLGQAYPNLHREHHGRCLLALVGCGADCVKVGIGPIFIAGPASSPVSAFADPPCSTFGEALRDTGVPGIADGRIRFSGDSKAIAAWRQRRHDGCMFAGTDESPGGSHPWTRVALLQLPRHGVLGAMGKGRRTATSRTTTRATSIVRSGRY